MGENESNLNNQTLPMTAGRNSSETTISKDLVQGEKYKIGDILAVGGMGSVLKAKDINCRRTVAMKTILNENVKDQDSVTRFIEEAQVTAQLEHPNIVPVYELGIDKLGNPFYTMKMVGGRTLKDIIKAISTGDKKSIEEFPLNRLLNIFLRVCDAIAYAHSKGVIHRDLKPENIMVGDFGEVQVMDWGIAKIINNNDVGAKSDPALKTFNIDTIRFDETDGLQTQYGKILGTPAYMAPEQAFGKIDELDGQSDIYALGGILYNILTLRNPVQGKNAQQILMKVIGGEIESPTVFNRMTNDKGREFPLVHCPESKVPGSLSAVAMKALALDRNVRYKDVEALQSEIEAYLNGFATSAEKAGPFKQFQLLLMRNKGISLTSAAAITVIIVLTSLFIVKVKKESLEALRQKENALVEKGRAETNEKLAQDKTKELLQVSQSAAPRFLSEAKIKFAQMEWLEAMTSIDIAVGLDPSNGESWFQKGRMHLAEQELKKAFDSFQKASLLGHTGGQAFHKTLTKYVALLNNTESLPFDKKTELIKDLKSLNDHHVLSRMYTFSNNAKQEIKDRLKVVQGAYTDQGAKMEYDFYNDNELNVELSKANNLKLLAGLPIFYLTIHDSKNIDSLKPLSKMPLRVITIKGGNYKLRDLSGLEDSNLTDINIGDAINLENIKELKGLKLKSLALENAVKLKSLQGLENSTNLEKVYIKSCSSLTSISELKSSPITDINIFGCSSLKNLDGLQNIKNITKLSLHKCSALESFDGMQNLGIREINTFAVSNLKSLEGLQGNPLTGLYLSDNKNLEDISALQGLPLETLELNNCPKIKSLKGLKGVPLKKFVLTVHNDNFKKNQNTKLISLDGLQGDQLQTVEIRGYSGFKNFTPLKGQPIKHLTVRHCESIENFRGLENGSLESLTVELFRENNLFTSLEGLEGNPLKKLILISFPYKVKDLSLLKDLPLEELEFNNKVIDYDLRFLKQLTSLKIFRHNEDHFILKDYLSSLKTGAPKDGIKICDQMIDSYEGVTGFESLINTVKKLRRNLSFFDASSNQIEGAILNAKEFNGHYYFLFPKTVKWREAEWQCHRYGAEIVTINSKEELEFIQKTFEPHLPIWLGGTTALTKDNSWKWMTGEKWDGVVESFETAVRDRSLTLNNGKIKDYHIDEFFTFIMEWEPEIATLLKKRIKDIHSQKLSEAATSFNGHKYFLYPEFIDRNEAENICTKHGAHLATITSKEEYEFVKTQVKGLEVWLGGYRDDSNNWKWVTGEPWSFEKWATNFPKKEQGFIYLNLSWGNSTYLNFPNNYKRMFLMEWDSE